MKKIYTLLISIILIISFTGCGSIINTKGEPSQELADSVISENHSGATFKEKVKSKAGEEDIWTFYYETPVKAKITTGYTTYAIEFHYNEEAKQWDYSPVKDVGTRYDWDIEGTWHPIINEYRTWYASCVMTIGKIENDQVHITFEKDGVVHFDETIPFNNSSGTSFKVRTTNSMWQDIDMYILPTGVVADRNGTRVGCDFERVSKPQKTETDNKDLQSTASVEIPDWYIENGVAVKGTQLCFSRNDGVIMDEGVEPTTVRVYTANSNNKITDVTEYIIFDNENQAKKYSAELNTYEYEGNTNGFGMKKGQSTYSYKNNIMIEKVDKSYYQTEENIYTLDDAINSYSNNGWDINYVD